MKKELREPPLNQDPNTNKVGKEGLVNQLNNKDTQATVGGRKNSQNNNQPERIQ